MNAGCVCVGTYLCNMLRSIGILKEVLKRRMNVPAAIVRSQHESERIEALCDYHRIVCRGP
jgi:ABC-type uncharacterized transport system ATPase subunit